MQYFSRELKHEMGRVIRVTKTISGDQALTILTAYDLSGKVTSISYPGNYWVDYAYHPGTNLLNTVTDSNSSIFAQCTAYEPTGKIKIIEHPYNNTQTEYDYDPLSTRLTNILTRNPNTQSIIQEIGDVVDYRDKL